MPEAEKRVAYGERVKDNSGNKNRRQRFERFPKDKVSARARERERERETEGNLASTREARDRARSAY